MKILVISSMLKDRHKEQILGIAKKYNAEVCFAGAEGEALPLGKPDHGAWYGRHRAVLCQKGEGI